MSNNFSYNTQREKLKMPEYGRNLQEIVDFALKIEDREERTKAAYAIVSIMSNLNPHYKETSDFKHKLWDHLAIISDFKLDVDAPYPPPSAENIFSDPNKIPYCRNRIRYRHYGKAIELLIEKAIEMEEGFEKNNLVYAIANHMKRLYYVWNNDKIIADEIIFKDLEEISRGRITVNKDMIKLSSARQQKKKTQEQHTNGNKKFNTNKKFNKNKKKHKPSY